MRYTAGRVLRSLALLPFLFVSHATLAQEDAEIEEVVVTGSYLKKTTADSPSPLSVVTRANIEEIGAVDIKDIVNNLTYQSGGINNSSGFYGGDSSNGNVSINLRNLGNGSTLVLINGRRNVTTNFDNVGNGYVDLSGLVPTIAIERVEVVKDGSSALYGSDAVAGVVNFITRENFEGFDMQFEYGVDDETGEQKDSQMSMIFGVAGDRGGATVSASYLDRKGLQIGDRFETFGRSGLSTFGQPGRYVALGPVTATPSFFNPAGSAAFGEGADPDCNLAAADDGPKGVLGNVNGLCIYDFSSFFNLVSPQEQIKMHASANFQLSDNVEIWGEASFSDNEIRRGNSLFPDVSFAIIPANNPGLELDAARRGIAPLPYLALQRLLGGHDDTPSSDRPVDTESIFDRQFFRLATGATADLTFNDRAWTLDVSGVFSERNATSVTPSDTITSNTDAAYIGFGGENCNRDAAGEFAGSGNEGAGNCFFYNPFATSRYDPVTGARWNTADTTPWAADPTITVQQAALRYQNSDELLQWIAGEIQSNVESDQVVFDAVLAGDLWETDNGNIGLAVGAQYRREEIRFNNDKNLNDNNYKFVFGAQDWEGQLTTRAVFVELFIPLAPWAELTLAGRYEDFDEIGVDTTDPKATLMLRPTDDLTIRASIGTSFRVGSLLQLFGQQTTLLNSTDPFSGTGGLAFRPTLTSGNAELQPEEATAWNIGLSWAPSEGALEGLTVDFDFWNYEYDDIITREAHQALINEDNALRCPNGVNFDAMAGPLCGVQPDGTIISIGAGLPDKVVRDPSGNLLRTQASYLNAQELEAAGIDLTAGYTWDMENLGNFRTQLNLSWMMDYDLVDPNGNSIDGIGSRNAGNTVGHPLPEYKANLLLGWSRDRHSVIVNVNYVDEYEDDLPQSALRGAFIGFAPTIDSMTTVDIQYNFQLPAFSFQSEGSTVTLGMKNALNEEPPLLNNDGAFDPFTHDPRGRIFYARYNLRI